MYTFLDIQWDVLRGINADKSHAGFLSVSHIMYKELLLSAISEALNKTYFFQVMENYTKLGTLHIDIRVKY